MLLSWWNWSVWWGYFCHVWVDRLKIERGFIVYNQAGDGWIEVQKIATQRRFQMVVKCSSVRRNATHCFELNGDWFKFVRAWVHAKQLCAVLKSLYVMLCKRCYLLLVCQIATDTNSQHVSNGRCQCNNVGRSDKTKDREREREREKVSIVRDCHFMNSECMRAICYESSAQNSKRLAVVWLCNSYRTVKAEVFWLKKNRRS